MLDRLSLRAAAPVEEILGHVLAETAYADILEASEDPTDSDRLANIQELLTAAREFDEQNPVEAPLETFLEQTALVNDTDAWEAETDRATLMTLHAAKGLEFPVVYIVAVESGLLPHERSKDDPDKLEEERRLLFVGITRAEEHLQLSMAEYRSFRGQRWPTVPSPFLMELPREEMELRELAAKRVNRASHPFDDAPVDDDIYFDPGSDVPFEADEAPVADDDLSFDFGANAKPKITTAANLLPEKPTAAEPEREPVYPSEMFTQGMTVVHPEYGPGKIVALNGPHDRRIATVNFASGAGQKKLRLDFAPLRPV